MGIARLGAASYQIIDLLISFSFVYLSSLSGAFCLLFFSRACIVQD